MAVASLVDRRVDAQPVDFQNLRASAFHSADLTEPLVSLLWSRAENRYFGRSVGHSPI